MADSKRAGLRSVILAAIGLLTAAAPGILSLLEITSTTETATQADAKADLGYDLLRQRVEFLVERLDQNCADVREIRLMLMTRSTKEQPPPPASSAVTPPVGRRHASAGSGGALRSPASTSLDDLEDLLSSLETTEDISASVQPDPTPVQQQPLPRSLSKALKEQTK